MSTKDKKIGVIGLGYVGLPLAINFGKVKNFKVYGFDIDEKKIRTLEAGKSYISHIHSKNIEKFIEPSLVSPRKRIKGKAVKDKAGQSSYAGPIDVNFPTKEIRKNYVADLRARSKLPQGDPARMTDQQMADKYF